MILVSTRNMKEIYYTNSIFSAAFCIQCSAILLAVIFPFLIVFASYNIYLSDQIAIFQPKVSYDNKFALFANIDGQSLMYSNILGLQQTTDLIQSPASSFLNTDYDLDGYNDKIQQQFSFYSTDASKVQSIFVVLEFQYEVTQIFPMNRKIYVTYQAQNKAGISKVEFISKLSFEQRIRFIYSQNVIQDDQLVDIFNYQTQNDTMGILNSLLKYQDQQQNVNSKYESIIYPSLQSTQTLVNIEIDIQNQKYFYKPYLLDNLKFMWIQIFSILAPFLFITTNILMIIFQYRSFKCNIQNELQPKPTNILQSKKNN